MEPKDPRTLDKLYDGIYNTYNDWHMWLTPFVSAYNTGGCSDVGDPSGEGGAEGEEEDGGGDRRVGQGRESGVGENPCNTVYMVFDEPVAISRITLYNYSKTPSRGVSEIEIYIDDAVVYRGTLRRAPPKPTITKKAGQGQYVQRETRRVGRRGGREEESAPNQLVDFGQVILFTNDPSIIAQHGHRVYTADVLAAEDQGVVFIDEGVSIGEAGGGSDVGMVRPMTAAVSEPVVEGG
ncbi:unnamed protein product [Discosporangium mesarthrocarpum]